ncbi:hypothetical protein SLA2020_039140 [Shorea laevis]
MENGFKLRISRMFRSSFGSCRTRNVPDVIEKAVVSPKKQRDFQVMEPLAPLSPKARPFPTICRKTAQTINRDCIMIAPRETLPRRKVSARYPPFFVSAPNVDGHKCPPASPVSPFNPFSDCKNFGFYEKKKNSGRKKKNKNQKKNLRSSSSLDTADHNGVWWFSSEDETETLFSSKSTFSSDSSESRRRRRRHSRWPRYRRHGKSEMGVFPVEGITKVKDSFAVVKSSSDPYSDFRISMVEMIVERQIFAAKDLEQLLQCFLLLNSHHHHRIILEVFTEIWEALFSNWC